ncbi:MAG: trigger factor [Actinomycetota bacterium]|nr:trigger factor [Actinomycetota bacterium]
MKSAAETLNPTRVKLTIEVPFEELKPSLDQAYKKIARQIQVPGFRKGKIPAAIIDQRIGRGPVLDEAVNDALPGLYMQALQDNELNPLGQPDIDVTRFEDGEVLEFTAELDIVPAIEVPDYEGLEVSVDDATVTDEDVDEQVDALRARFGTLHDVQRAAVDGDFVTIDLSASKDGEPIEEAQTAGLSYQVGQGTMLDGLDEALVGLSAEESATFTSQLVGAEYDGTDVEIEVSVSAVKEQELPDLDDDFAQTASEFDTVAELRTDLIEKLIRGRRLEQANAARDAVLEVLLDRVDIALPDALVAEEKQARSQQIEQQLSYAGMTFAAYLESEEQTEEEFSTDLERRVRESLAARFLLDEVAKVEQLGVSEQELTQHVVRRAQQSGTDPNEYVRHAMEHNHVPELVGEIRRGKALARIVEAAKVCDQSGNEVDLKRLQPDGSLGDQVETTEDAGPAADDVAGRDTAESSNRG